MKINREPEIAIGIIAITFALGFLIFTHCIEKESKETEILNLSNESVLVDEQPTKYKRFVIGVDRSRMKLYDVEESAQSDIMSDPIPDKPISTWGDRENKDTFSEFKI